MSAGKNRDCNMQYDDASHALYKKRTDKDGEGYRGCVNEAYNTINPSIALKCWNWNRTDYAYSAIMEKKGLGMHNFCRNPDGDKQGLWCYTGSMKKTYCIPPKE